MNMLFAFDAADAAADPAADPAAVRAAASMPLCFRWRRFRFDAVELQTLAGGEGGSLPSMLQCLYLVGEPGSLSDLWRLLARRNASASFTSRLLSSAISVLAPRCGDVVCDRRASLLWRLILVPQSVVGAARAVTSSALISFCSALISLCSLSICLSRTCWFASRTLSPALPISGRAIPACSEQEEEAEARERRRSRWLGLRPDGVALPPEGAVSTWTKHLKLSWVVARLLKLSSEREVERQRPLESTPEALGFARPFWPNLSGLTLALIRSRQFCASLCTAAKRYEKTPYSGVQVPAALAAACSSRTYC